MARLGSSVVVGVDYTDNAVNLAKKLANELVPQLAHKPSVSFLCCDVLELPHLMPPNAQPLFDVVIASIGIVHWIKDLTAWTNVATSYLASGGFFYLHDFHPVIQVFEFGPITNPQGLEPVRPYWGSSFVYLSFYAQVTFPARYRGCICVLRARNEPWFRH